ISAAPGVDQARTIGIRLYTDSARLPIAIERHSTATQEAVCSTLAETASAAAITTATEPPKPTTTATRAERIRDDRMENSSTRIGSNYKLWIQDRVKGGRMTDEAGRRRGDQGKWLADVLRGEIVSGAIAPG